MNRAHISACLGALLGCVAIAAPAQNRIFFPQAHRTAAADHSPLPYQVHIAPTAMKSGSTSIDVGSDHWSAKGYDLKELIAQVFDIDARRIDFADDSLAQQRFDLTLDVPVDLDAEAMQQVLAEAIQKRFQLSIAPETRPMDVYVLTAPNGKGPALHPHVFASARKNAAIGQDADSDSSDEERITYYGKNCPGSVAIGLEVDGGTIPDLRKTLEPDLDRVLLDETHLTGSYDFQIGNYSDVQQLFQLLRDQLGLVITPEQRNVTVLTVRPAGAGDVLRANL